MTPKSLDPDALAHESSTGFGSGMRAYAASKLCNLLTAQSFARLDDVGDRQISVIAFNPGLAGDNSPGGDSSRARRAATLLMRSLFRLVGFFRPQYVMGTPERSGQLLAELCLGAVAPPPGQIYVSQVKGEPTFPDPSELARTRYVQDQLWYESAVMVGMG